MKEINELNLCFKAISVNESFARTAVSSFCVMADPTLDEITDIKTAVSEAVTNVVVHAYPNKIGYVKIHVLLFEDKVEIEISDEGIGIDDIEKAKEPFFTTKPNEERSGMGFAVMQSFMDLLKVEKNSFGGTTVYFEKNFCKKNNIHLEANYNVE